MGKNLREILLDSDNKDTIEITTNDGETYEFEQVAVIPYEKEKGNEDLYCLLKPLDTIEGIGDNEAIVFKLVLNNDNEWILKVEDNDLVSKNVYLKYAEMMMDTLCDDPNVNPIEFMDKSFEMFFGRSSNDENPDEEDEIDTFLEEYKKKRTNKN